MNIVNDETNSQAAIEDNKAQFMLNIKAIIEKKFVEDGLIGADGQDNGEFLSNHKVMFNFNMKCLQSNIFMIDKNRALLKKFEENPDVKTPFLEQLKVLAQQFNND